jgi:hypothetical protein
VNAGATTAAVDAEGYTPAQQALASDHSEVGAWLLQCSSNTSSSSTCSGSAGATLRSSPHSSSSRSMSPFCQQLQQQCSTGSSSSSNGYAQLHSEYSSSVQRGCTLDMSDCDDMQEDCLDATAAAATECTPQLWTQEAQRSPPPLILSPSSCSATSSNYSYNAGGSSMAASSGSATAAAAAAAAVADSTTQLLHTAFSSLSLHEKCAVSLSLDQQQREATAGRSDSSGAAGISGVMSANDKGRLDVVSMHVKL